MEEITINKGNAKEQVLSLFEEIHSLLKPNASRLSKYSRSCIVSIICGIFSTNTQIVKIRIDTITQAKVIFSIRFPDTKSINRYVLQINNSIEYLKEHNLISIPRRISMGESDHIEIAYLIQIEVLTMNLDSEENILNFTVVPTPPNSIV